MQLLKNLAFFCVSSSFHKLLMVRYDGVQGMTSSRASDLRWHLQLL